MKDDAISAGQKPGLIAFATANGERLDARAELTPIEMWSTMLSEDPKEREDTPGIR